MVTKIDRLARLQTSIALSPSSLRGVWHSRSWMIPRSIRKLIMGILALIAEFENDIRRERQMDGITKAKAEGARFGKKPMAEEKIAEIKALRADGNTVPEIMRQMGLSKSTVYRALGSRRRC